MRTYVLYLAAVAASANAAAQIDIKGNGKIIGVSWAVCSASSPTAADALDIELGFNSAMQSTNDAAGIIDQIAIGIGASATGIAVHNANLWRGPMAYPVKLGDRLYLNVVEAGSSSWKVRCTIHVA